MEYYLLEELWPLLITEANTHTTRQQKKKSSSTPKWLKTHTGKIGQFLASVKANKSWPLTKLVTTFELSTMLRFTNKTDQLPGTMRKNHVSSMSSQTHLKSKWKAKASSHIITRIQLPLRRSISTQVSKMKWSLHRVIFCVEVIIALSTDSLPRLHNLKKMYPSLCRWSIRGTPYLHRFTIRSIRPWAVPRRGTLWTTLPPMKLPLGLA